MTDSALVPLVVAPPVDGDLWWCAVLERGEISIGREVARVEGVDPLADVVVVTRGERLDALANVKLYEG